ncbi:MAG TPA: hypothetical protein VJ914_37285 [Pseudonocardiaceae bacterium]|nr:hypothetical protein [Pseudonocardiaceae bacterium]
MAAVPSNAAVAPHAHSQAATSTPAGSTYTPVTPTRLLDTRSSTPIPANSGIGLGIPTNLVPADATGVVLNLTGLDAAGGTYLSMKPFADFNASNVSNLNIAAGEIRSNQVTLPLVGSPRDEEIRTGPSAADAVVDLEGFYAPSAGFGFTSLAPQRVLDTRDGTGGQTGPVGSGQTITLDLSAQLPAGATAAVFNLTAVDPTDGTFVTAWPAGQSLPTVSNLNVAPGTVTPNLVTVGVSSDRKVSLYNKNGSTDLVADLAGYYSPGSTQVFYPLSPLRVLDTRDGNGNPLTPIGPNSSREVGLSGWLPANASSAIVNLTGTNVTDGTFVTAWPAGQDRPTASNLNLAPGQTSANLAAVSLGTGGAIDLYNLNGNVDVIVDLFGYFAPQLAPCTAKCVVGFGTNTAGRLGNGTTSSAAQTASTVFGLSDVIAVAASGDFGAEYALRSDGTVWSWGSDGAGQLGNGTSGNATEPTPYGDNIGQPFDSPVPVQVHGLSNVVAIAPGLALKSDGTVWSWGDNVMWELGDGNTDGTAIATTPVQVSGLTNVTAIANNGYNGYALTSDGKVWDWGSNIQGNLGNGTSGATDSCSAGQGISPIGPNCASAVPVQVSGLSGVVKIGAGQAVTSDGHVWQWGPDGYPNQNNTPVQVQGLSNVTALADSAQGESTQYALESNGTVWSWGYNSFQGSYGNGTTCTSGPCFSDTPVQVSGITNATAIASATESGYALTSDGTVWAWGGGQDGELGNGNYSATADVPQQVPGLSGVTALGDYGYSLVP